MCVCSCAHVHVHVCAHTPVWLGKDFAYYFPFPHDQSLSYGPQQSLHNSTCTFPFTPFLCTKDKKLREWGWMGVFYFFQRGKLQRKPVIGKILFLALSSRELCSIPPHLTSAVCEERKKKAETIKKQFKAFPQISWEQSENIVRRGQITDKEGTCLLELWMLS